MIYFMPPSHPLIFIVLGIVVILNYTYNTGFVNLLPRGIKFLEWGIKKWWGTLTGGYNLLWGCIKLPNYGKQSHRRQPKKYQRLPTSCFSVTLLNKVKEGSLDVKTKIPQFDSKYKNVSHSLQLLGTSSWVGGALNTEGALNIVMGIQRGHHYFIWGEFNLVFLPLGGRGRKDSYLCPGAPWAWPLLQVSAGPHGL